MLTPHLTSCTVITLSHSQLFWLTHVWGFSLFLPALILHDPNIVYWMLPGVLLYCLDHVLRAWQYRCSSTYVSSEDGSLSVTGRVVTLVTRWHEVRGWRCSALVGWLV